MTAKKPEAAAIDPLLYDLDQTCADLGNIGKTTLYAEIKAGELETLRIGDRQFTTREMRLAYIERKRHHGRAA
jgi:hypothetical protein